MNNEINVNVIKTTKTGLFTNYIYKTIPLAFDESMSYYETLCGLLNYLKNTIIPTVDNNADAVIELQNLFETLQDYVNHYFDNLDVQDEINNKLDEMIEDGSLYALLSLQSKYPLYNAGINATVTGISNVPNVTIPTLSDNINTVLNYAEFDNVIESIVSYTNYNDISYQGHQFPIENITLSSIDYEYTLPENYIKPGMWIVLCTSTPTKSNYTYLGKITSATDSTINVSGWYNISTKEQELPTGVTYAWLNPVTKMYGQNISIHDNGNLLKSLIGSQTDIYGNENTTETGVIGYSPVLRNTNGNMAFRARANEGYHWRSVLRVEGDYLALIRTDNGVLFDGNDKQSFCGLSQLSNEFDGRSPLIVVSADFDLSSLDANAGALYYFYNNTTSPVLLTGTFRGINLTTPTTKIQIPPQSVMPLLALTEKIYTTLTSYLHNPNVNIRNDNYHTRSIAITKNTNVTDDIYPSIATGQQAHFDFITGGSDITLSITTGHIYINGVDASSSTTIKARTSGSMIVNKINNTVYINSVQPA